ncbi:cation diffusion facilitator family transporter [Pedobacter alpinus]|uniref:Cation diffusion facilitator family transporter n=1 Tax=Pedobacter alpinus TaxID=1590643 RepID=A0ABW5TWE7_9SPHI
MQPKLKIILASLLISIVLMLLKFLAYFITHSNAILTDAAESIVNVLASGFAFYSVYLAAMPKDKNHPYGHGKIEFFSAFVEGTLIIIAGLVIIIKSVFNLIYPQNIVQILDGTLIIGFTGLVNGLLGWYLIAKSKTLNSITIQADGKHLITDAISSFGLVLGLILIYFTNLNYLDSVISIALGFFIIYNGYRLTRKSVGGLMDESDLKALTGLVSYLNQNRQPSWIDIHNLRMQHYGADIHIDCHVTLPYYFDLNRVHQEVSNIDDLISKNINDQTEFFIHADPCLPKCCHYCSLENCNVRQEPQTKIITWRLDNVTKNQKHFEQ